MFKRLKSLAGGRQTKFCVPSPSHIYGELSWSDNIGGKDSIYVTPQELKAGLIGAYKEFVEEYASAGGEILQFDDCLWEIFADDNTNSPYTGENIDQETVRALAVEFIDINNTLIDFGHKLGLKMRTHNCRGNYDSRNMGGGSYIKITELFLKQLNTTVFFLNGMMREPLHWMRLPSSRINRRPKSYSVCFLVKQNIG
jgi:methionine synthase II (cobalamin-independent)